MEMELAQDTTTGVHHTRKELGNYVFGKTLGEGTFGKVKLATHKSTGEVVAIKILEKDKIMDVADVERVSRQIHILKLVRHPNIIQLYEIIETPKQLFLVMEYIENGELFHYIVKNKRVSQEQACKMFHELISGIEYIHRLNIVHRDLKPENLLLDYKYSLKLVDFGLSNTYKKDETLKTPCGSPCYAAPEMIRGEKYSGLRVDIWSSGVILFAMVCGCLPFEDNDTSKLYKKILSGKFTPVSGISEAVKDLLSKILNTDPEKRSTIEEIRQHEWMRTCKSPRGSQGIVVGYNRIPVDRKIIEQVEKVLKIQADYATKCVQANRHNSVTTAYYLMFKKHLKTGGSSICDLASSHFDRTLIEPNNRTSANSRPKSKAKSGYMTHSVHDKENRQTGNKDISSIGNFDIVIKNTHKPDANTSSKYSSTRHQETHRKSLKSNKNSKNNINSGTEKFVERKLRDFGSKELLSKELVPKPPFSREPISASSYNSRINKKYREEFNKSLVSRSREKQRLSIASTRNNKSQQQQRMRVISTQSTKIGRQRVQSVMSIPRDRNKSSFAAQISRQDLNTRKAVNSSSIDFRQHKRGKSNQMRKVHVNNQSFNGVRNGETYYKRQRI